MKTGKTTRPVNGSFRALALALGDERVHDARLREPGAETAIPAIVALLEDASPNVRIGVCRLVRLNADVLLRATPMDRLAQVREALRDALGDRAANEYAYGGFQCDEEDVQYVADEAQAALSSLRAMPADHLSPRSHCSSSASGGLRGPSADRTIG